MECIYVFGGIARTNTRKSGYERNFDWNYLITCYDHKMQLNHNVIGLFQTSLQINSLTSFVWTSINFFYIHMHVLAVSGYGLPKLSSLSVTTHSY